MNNMHNNLESLGYIFFNLQFRARNSIYYIKWSQTHLVATIMAPKGMIDETATDIQSKLLKELLHKGQIPKREFVWGSS